MVVLIQVDVCYTGTFSRSCWWSRCDVSSGFVSVHRITHVGHVVHMLGLFPGPTTASVHQLTQSYHSNVTLFVVVMMLFV